MTRPAARTFALYSCALCLLAALIVPARATAADFGPGFNTKAAAARPLTEQRILQVIAAVDDLRGTRDVAELTALLSGFWNARKDRYSEMRSETPANGNHEKVQMFTIGG